MRAWIVALCALLFSVGTAFAAVNANTASVDELQTVSGIGPAIAQRIVDERRNGPFKSLDDLQARVKGVGEASIRKMAAAGLTVGPSRAAPAKAGSTADAKADAKAVAKADPKADPKADAKTDPKAAPKAEAAKTGARP